MQERPNRDRLGKAVDIYRDALRNFIVETLQRIKGATVAELLLRPAERDQRIYQQRKAALDAGKKPAEVIDVNDFPHIVNFYWQDAFGAASKYDKNLRNRMHLIAEGRNDAYHPGEADISFANTVGYLDDIHTVLKSIRADAPAAKVDSLVQAFTPPQSSNPPSLIPPSGGANDSPERESNANGGRAPANGLAPWRDVIKPHRDLLGGEITADIFAADLQEVADGRGFREYQNAVSFFNRSYLTPGIKRLMVNMLRRCNGNGGESVVQLKTGFGGGKTHSLIALHHLAESGAVLADLATNPTDATGEALQSIYRDASIEPATAAGVKSAVLSGTWRSATESTTSETGNHRLNSLWAYMAWHLGGEDGFAFVAEAAENWQSPGVEELRALLEHVGPCVILIDELVLYVRNLSDDQQGYFYTFLQRLTEAARSAPNALLVVSVPEAGDELGGPRGVAAAASIERILGRLETISAPLQSREGFEVVRKRLFDEGSINQAELAKTVEKFFNLYRSSPRDYPDEASKPPYEKRLEKCYPIHPEIFDRLFEDWSAISGFQRTRGLLRMIAVAIRMLHRDSHDPLIMPGNLRLDDPDLRGEFVKLLGDGWDPPLQEADGVMSKAEALDKRIDRFGRCGDGAAKRVARTIFLGSAPAALSGRSITGIDEGQIRLGTTRPRDGVSVYNEARNNLVRLLHYLRVDTGRYFFNTLPGLLKLHEDVASQIGDTERDETLKVLIRPAFDKNASNTVYSVMFPASTEDVPDDDRLKLIVLDPGCRIGVRGREDDHAGDFALEVVKQFGERPRLHRNTILFLAVKYDNARMLREEAKNYLAWKRIFDQAEQFNISSTQKTEAGEYRAKSQAEIDRLIATAYANVLVPLQANPQESEYRIKPYAVTSQAGKDLVEQALATLIEAEEIVSAIGLSQFEAMLNRWFWKPGVDHVEIGDVWDTLTRHIYMERFLNQGVLEDAVRAATGNAELDYGLADHYDPDRGYSNVRNPGQQVSDGLRLLVKGEALRASEELLPPPPFPTPPVDKEPGHDRGDASHGQDTEDPGPTASRSAVATKSMVGTAAAETDYNLLRDHIVEALRRAGADVEVTFNVRGNNPDGFDENAKRAIAETGQQLGVPVEFDS